MVEDHESDAMAIYKAGLSVYTTLDAQAQKWAVDAVRKGARMYERRHGWRVKFDNVLEEGGGSVEDYRDPSWIAVPEAGDIMTGMIREVSERGAQVSFGSYSAFITAEHTECAGQAALEDFQTRRSGAVQDRVCETGRRGFCRSRSTLSRTFRPRWCCWMRKPARSRQWSAVITSPPASSITLRRPTAKPARPSSPSFTRRR